MFLLIGIFEWWYDLSVGGKVAVIVVPLLVFISLIICCYVAKSLLLQNAAVVSINSMHCVLLRLLVNDARLYVNPKLS